MLNAAEFLEQIRIEAEKHVTGALGDGIRHSAKAAREYADKMRRGETKLLTGPAALYEFALIIEQAWQEMQVHDAPQATP